MGRSQMPFYPHNQDWRLFNAYQGYYNPYDAIDQRNKPLRWSRLFLLSVRILRNTAEPRVQVL